MTGAALGMGLTAAHRLYTPDVPMVLVDLNEAGIRGSPTTSVTTSTP